MRMRTRICEREFVSVHVCVCVCADRVYQLRVSHLCDVTVSVLKIHRLTV